MMSRCPAVIGGISSPFLVLPGPRVVLPARATRVAAPGAAPTAAASTTVAIGCTDGLSPAPPPQSGRSETRAGVAHLQLPHVEERVVLVLVMILILVPMQVLDATDAAATDAAATATGVFPDQLRPSSSSAVASARRYRWAATEAAATAAAAVGAPRRRLLQGPRLRPTAGVREVCGRHTLLLLLLLLLVVVRKAVAEEEA